ncbi:MAG: glycosyltransferase family 2 protein [Solirubrobacterales bacterium]
MAELTIVIPTYRRHEILAETLDALDRQVADPARFEVTVVDDPAGDDPEWIAAAIAARKRRFAVRQLHAEVPDNVSAKRNVGWRSATTPLVMFIGDDILADPELVAEHLGWHERHPEAEMAMLGHIRWADRLKVTPFMRWLDRGIQFDFDRLDRPEAGWGMFYTSNVSVKREMLEQVGGFDQDRFPFIYEDTDLGWRLYQAGLRLIHAPSARAEHLHAPSLEGWEERMAATAGAERRWVELHPELEPYFECMFRRAAGRPPARSRPALALASCVRPEAPLIGSRIWWHVDLHYRQRLGPAFLSAWDAAEQLSRTP